MRHVIFFLQLLGIVAAFVVLPMFLAIVARKWRRAWNARALGNSANDLFIGALFAVMVLLMKFAFFLPLVDVATQYFGLGLWGARANEGTVLAIYLISSACDAIILATLLSDYVGYWRALAVWLNLVFWVVVIGVLAAL